MKVSVAAAISSKKSFTDVYAVSPPPSVHVDPKAVPCAIGRAETATSARPRLSQEAMI